MSGPAAKTSTAARHFDKGRLLYCAGENGQAWRVLSGAVRLNDFAGEEMRFAGLAVAGDVIGIEALYDGRYGFEASALTACLVEPWQPGSDAIGELQQLCRAAARQTAELLALRTDTAELRVLRLVDLLARGHGRSRYADTSTLALPSLRNVAEITDLSMETVSRIISRWRQQGCDVAGRSRSGLRMRWPLAGIPVPEGAIQQERIDA